MTGSASLEGCTATDFKLCLKSESFTYPGRQKPTWAPSPFEAPRLRAEHLRVTENTMSQQPIETLSGSIRAGLACVCPRCGRGKLFQGFLTPRPHCEVCGLDYGFADAGDGPAVFIMFLAGFIVVGAALGPRGAVAAADRHRHDRPVTADEGADDRAAIPSQSRRGTLRQRR